MAGNTLPSSKRTLLGRHTEEARVVLKGNKDVASRWINHGRGLLGFVRHNLAQGKIDIGSRKALMPDGTRIEVLFNGAINQIIIDSSAVPKEEEELCLFYEESGLDVLDFTTLLDYREIESGTLYRCEDDVYDPPFSPKKQAELKMLLEDMPESGEKSKAIYRPLFEQYGSTHDDPAIQAALDAEAWTLYRFTKHVMRLAPGMYSGKIQLLLESRLGSKKVLQELSATDPTLDGDLGFPYYTLLERDLHWNCVTCHGLFTVPDYKRYYLINIGPSMTATRVRLTTCGNMLLAYLRKHFEDHDRIEIRKIEALILSRAKFGTVYPLERIGDAVTVTSIPLGEYGWHWNWQGTQADLVTVDDSEEFSHDRFIGRHYRMSFTFNEAFLEDPENNLPVQYSTQLVEETYFKKPQRSRIMWHEYLFRMMFSWRHYTGPPSIGVLNDGPLYCFYDKEDYFRMVRYKYETDVGIECPSLNAPLEGAGYWFYCEYPHYKDFSVPETGCGNTTRYGFYVTTSNEDEEDYETPVLDISQYRVYRFASMESLVLDVPLPSVSSTGVECSPSYPWGTDTNNIDDDMFCPSIGGSVPPVWNLEPETTLEYVHTYNYEYTKSIPGVGQTMLLIPEFDCESVFIIKREVNAKVESKFRDDIVMSGFSVQFIYQGDDVELFNDPETGIQCTRWSGYHLWLVRGDSHAGGMYRGPLSVESRTYLGVYLVNKNCSPIEVIPYNDENLTTGNPFKGAVAVDESQESPLYDTFNVRCKRGLNDTEAVFTNSDDDTYYLDYDHTRYPIWESSPYLLPTYVGWA